MKIVFTDEVIMCRNRCLPAIVCLFALTVTRTPAQDRIFQPYIDLSGRTTSIRQLGEGDLFLPLWQDGESLLFADMRGLWSDNQAAEGNWGLAYRQVLPSDWIAGTYVFYDTRRTELNNTFHQGTAGVELLSVDWGFRANGYIPDQSVKAAPGANAAFLQGGNIVVQPGLEAAYWGTDFEVERLLWYRNAKSEDCGECGPEWSLDKLDMEFWAAAGFFHFDNEAAGFRSITGPRVRAEWRLYDLPVIGPDSRVVRSV